MGKYPKVEMLMDLMGFLRGTNGMLVTCEF